LVLACAGYDAPQANVAPSANTAIGARIDVMTGGELRKVGFYSTTAGTHVHAALYTVTSFFPDCA
jgi:hypothetical protein